tara:strand:- start:110 stop:544 length:435 start_codon:yes stop_codon:yes gene_type:complete
MKIINPLLTTHTISVLPRKTYSEGNISEDYSFRVDSDGGIVESLSCTEVIQQETTLILINEDTNKSTTVFADNVVISSNQMVFTISDVVFKEGERYTFKIYKLEEEIFRGLLFVTQYDQNNYTINNNEFVVDVDTDSESIKVYE